MSTQTPGSALSDLAYTAARYRPKPTQSTVESKNVSTGRRYQKVYNFVQTMLLPWWIVQKQAHLTLLLQMTGKWLENAHYIHPYYVRHSGAAYIYIYIYMSSTTSDDCRSCTK